MLFFFQKTLKWVDSIVDIPYTSMMLSTLILSSVLCFAPPSKATRSADELRPLLDAICMVESGGKNLVGDGGKAIGPFQIHKCYWQDAVDFDKSIGGSYKDCGDRAYAEKIVVAYLNRYAPKCATNEELARMHNGGCAILKRKGTKAWDNTTKYWNKVEKQINVNP